MLHSSAEPPLALARPLSRWPSRWTLPWLLSTTTHAVLLVSLVLVFQFTQPVWRGTGLTSAWKLVLSSGDGDAGGGGTDPLGNDSTSGGELYYDDEPAPFTRVDLAPGRRRQRDAARAAQRTTRGKLGGRVAQFGHRYGPWRG